MKLLVIGASRGLGRERVRQALQDGDQVADARSPSVLAWQPGRRPAS